jgi:DNA polymerase-3 subunit alpha
MSYVGLHVHTHYSLFDGVATPEEYIDRAVELGMPALAITDHGTLSGHRELYRIAKAKGVKPILGVEGYMCQDRFDRRPKSERTDPLDLVYNHIVLLAKNQIGLENLNKINEIAWTEGYFNKPRFDFETLEKYKEGIIVTSACPSGAIAKAIEHGEYAIAKKHISWFKKVFEEDYYIEIMPHNSSEVNKQLIELADEFKVQIVVTPDCHHVDNSQKEIQEFKLLMNSHAKVLKESS